jgi:hypothetical protein
MKPAVSTPCGRKYYFSTRDVALEVVLEVGFWRWFLGGDFCDIIFVAFILPFSQSISSHF